MTRPSRVNRAAIHTGAGHVLFIAVMIGASALTFLRMTVVALLLPVPDFALYATIVATGAFLAGPLSFGAIEGTIKRFPRLVADGHQQQMLSQARSIMALAVGRALLLAGPLLALGLLGHVQWALLAGVAALVALGSAATGLVASMQRAAGTPVTLAAGTVLRAGIAFGAVSLAALSGNLVAVIAAEIGGMIAASFVSLWWFFYRQRSGALQGAAVATGGHDGRLVFLAYLAVAAPFYLDRMYVTATMGGVAAAQYAVLALILLGSSLLINTIAQRAGPDAIRRIHTGAVRSAIVRTLGWIGFASAAWLAGITVFAGVLVMGLLPHSLERYAIAPALLVPLAATGVLLCTALLEFVIIGLDRERSFVIAAALFLVLVLAAALVVWLQAGDLATLMWAMVACRLVYAAALVVVLATSLRARGHASRPLDPSPASGDSARADGGTALADIGGSSGEKDRT